MSDKEKADLHIAKHDSHLKSIVKAFSWRVIATLTTMLAAYIVTGKLDVALKIGPIDFVAKLALYYGHERIWECIPFA
ncbi:hypothetical protein CYMTET_14051 [Cymbomonas tetramitiformis]|uniref:DUF2061 domain-containing protein n=1 Tax=Cymbomonas tetramitiformis TaxID=36881 RepID=A0AAE0GGU3_9CHLO|nr:hypothetical protein CYMTET_14051 [Cymbomonas tetramitiformis]